jgi:hypothetical protein
MAKKYACMVLMHHNTDKLATIGEDFFIAAVLNQRQPWTYSSGVMKLLAIYYLQTSMAGN